MLIRDHVARDRYCLAPALGDLRDRLLELALGAFCEADRRAAAESERDLAPDPVLRR